jgi:hypothetical protein
MIDCGIFKCHDRLWYFIFKYVCQSLHCYDHRWHCYMVHFCLCNRLLFLLCDFETIIKFRMSNKNDDWIRHLLSCKLWLNFKLISTFVSCQWWLNFKLVVEHADQISFYVDNWISVLVDWIRISSVDYFQCDRIHLNFIS